MSKSQNPSSNADAQGRKRRKRGENAASSQVDTGDNTQSGGSRPANGRTGSQRAQSAKSTGSVPKVNAAKPKGTTGSVPQVDVDRPKGSTGSTGSVPKANANRPKGSTGSAAKVNAGKSKGSTGAVSTGNARSKKGSTGSVPKANPSRPKGSTGSVGTQPSKKARPANSQAKSANRADSMKRRKHVAKHAAPTMRRYTGLKILLVLVFLAVIGAGGYLGYKFLFNPYEGATIEDGKEVTVVIPEGSSGSDIIDILLDAGVIHSSKDFRKAAKDQNADQSLKSGTYSFLTGSDPDEVVKQLVTGPNSSENQLKLPEGLTLTQTAAAVESALGIKQDDFIQQAKAANYVNDYPFLADAGKGSLEGYLYPKTYDFAGKEVTADSVIRLMLEQYASEVATLDMKAAEKALSDRYNLNVTDYDILKLASIIEKEALNEDDRSKISSVFYNRLEKGMALESDATMGYETGGAVTEKDLQTESAYNTYLHKGLPPTPICTPSLWAIQAAMEPADTEYFFFFIIDDGVYSNHTFSKTYEEHDSAYKEALAEQKAANANNKKEN